jgi:hypothetical protein
MSLGYHHFLIMIILHVLIHHGPSSYGRMLALTPLSIFRFQDTCSSLIVLQIRPYSLSIRVGDLVTKLAEA